jgi:hypothetical protein
MPHVIRFTRSLALIAALLAGGTSHAEPLIFASLLVDHVPWPADEVLERAHIVVRGASIKAVRSAGLVVTVKNGAAASTAILEWPPALRGLEITKEFQLQFLQDWLELRTPATTPWAMCPGQECPIAISGELTLASSSPKGWSNPRVFPAATSDFVFRPASSP